MRVITRSGELAALSAERILQELLKVLDTPTPSAFFDALMQIEALQILLPQLAQWWQDETHYQHTLAAVNTAIDAMLDSDIRFACLTHALVETDQLDAFCEALKAPKHLYQLAKLTHQLVQFTLEYLNAPPRAPTNASASSPTPTLTASTVLALFESADAFRRPDRFAKGVMALNCDPTVTKNPQCQGLGKQLMTALERAMTISGKTIIEACLSTKTSPPKGQAMGQAIRSAREAAIQQLIS
jgi:tRNA nucleotidyltransferase (CCA-adding enzyme)